jgi:hypothetical protein
MGMGGVVDGNGDVVGRRPRGKKLIKQFDGSIKVEVTIPMQMVQERMVYAPINQRYY